MAARGWIKLHRSFLDWEWYKDSNTKAVFIHLLLIANIEDKIFQGTLIKRGETATSYRSLSTSLALSERQTRTAIDHLKSTGEVTIRRCSKFSLITIVNYEKYQEIIKSVNDLDDLEKQGDKQNDNQNAEKRQSRSQSNDKQSAGNLTTTKEDKNIRREESKKADDWPQMDRESETETIKEAWNALGLQQLTSISQNQERDEKLQAILDKYGVDAVLQAIDNVQNSRFLQGGGKRGWKITFDWFVEPDHFIRVLENYYEEYGADQSASGEIPDRIVEARRASVAKSMTDFMNGSGSG